MSYLLAERDALELPTGDAEQAGWPRDAFDDLVGASPALRRTIDVARRLAQRGGPNLVVLGEPGTGREMLARAIHAAGPRANAPFLTIDCSAVPAAALEMELFGREAQTTAPGGRAKPGLLELAGEGTLFLGQVGHLPADLQPRLLRVLDERRFRRAYGRTEVEVRCRVIAASDAPLDELVSAGVIREDLYHRLAMVVLALPPLRDRGGDVLALADRFLADLEESHGIASRGFADATRAALSGHAWLGNVDELKAWVRRAAFAAGTDPIEARVGAHAEARTGAGGGAGEWTIRVPVGGRSLESTEAELVRVTLAMTGGNKSAASRILAISRPTLDRKISVYGLALPSAEEVAG